MAYYLPINSASLAHYFACACVKPARYFDNKPQDIQDILPNTLLLSTKLGNKNADCCLEIVLTNNEEKHNIGYMKGDYSGEKNLYFTE